jgi:phosphatidylserine/phosphatidylglycerophosphate/cardiolipin synthase-like enzyme
MRQRLLVLRSHWPQDVPGPRVYSREANPADEMAALHAKIIVCDRCRALVTSANFSRHGLHENIEIGVHVEASSVGRLADFLDALILHHEVEPVDW